MKIPHLAEFFKGHHATITDMLKWFALAPFLLFLVVPELASAQSGFVTCEGNYPNTCDFCHLVSTTKNIIDFLIGIAIVIATVIIVIAGVKLATSAGDVAARDTAKGYLINAIIGLIIVLASWLIIDTIMRILVEQEGEDAVVGVWNEIECPPQPYVHPTDPELRFGSDAPGVRGPGTGTGSQGSCEIAESGPCSPDALRDAGFGDLAEQASQIAGAESGCNTNAESGTDTTTDGRTYSVGTWQVNLASNELDCGGEYLNCPAAFQETGQRNEYGVRVQRVVDEDLYNKCVQAAKNPECNNRIGARLATNAGDMGDWACSARKCGIYTPRNDDCPLP